MHTHIAIRKLQEVEIIEEDSNFEFIKEYHMTMASLSPIHQ